MKGKVKTKRLLSFTFHKLPFLASCFNFLLDKAARLWIFFGNLTGNIYTALFSFLGTSWFDHRFDYLRGIKNYHWLERAFFALPLMSKHDYVLDIGCGDGIYSGIFYSEKARKVLAVDIDSKAILNAKKYYSRDNVRYVRKDVLTWEVPQKTFDVAILFSVIEHFSKQDGRLLLKKIHRSLKSDGIFLGSTPIFKNLNVSNWEHKNEFTSENQLKSFLRQEFSTIKITSSLWAKDRPECYFICKV